MDQDLDAAARARIDEISARAEIADTPFEGARTRWRRIGSGPPRPGRVGRPGGADHSERLAAPLRHGLDTLAGIGTAVPIAAFSFGSLPAVGLALHRGAVPRIALIGPTAHGLPRRTAHLRRWRDVPSGPEQDAVHRHNLSQQMQHDPAANDALALAIHRQAMLRTGLRSRPLSRSTATRDALDRFALPVLMLWGHHDVAGLWEPTARALAEGFPNRQWQVVPGAGHWLQYEGAKLVS